MVHIINRSVVVVKPQQPFMDWANRLGDRDLVLPLEEYRQDSTAYLFPYLDGEDDKERFLRRYHKFIFDNELSGWSTDESTWPTRRGYAAFLRWFEVEFHSVVIDLEEGSVVKEEF